MNRILRGIPNTDDTAYRTSACRANISNGTGIMAQRKTAAICIARNSAGNTSGRTGTGSDISIVGTFGDGSFGVVSHDTSAGIIAGDSCIIDTVFHNTATVKSYDAGIISHRSVYGAEILHTDVSLHREVLYRPCKEITE